MTFKVFNKKRSLVRIYKAVAAVTVVALFVACDYWGHAEALIRLGLR